MFSSYTVWTLKYGLVSGPCTYKIFGTIDIHCTYSDSQTNSSHMSRYYNINIIHRLCIAAACDLRDLLTLQRSANFIYGRALKRAEPSQCSSECGRACRLPDAPCKPCTVLCHCTDLTVFTAVSDRVGSYRCVDNVTSLRPIWMSLAADVCSSVESTSHSFRCSYCECPI